MPTKPLTGSGAQASGSPQTARALAPVSVRRAIGQVRWASGEVQAALEAGRAALEAGLRAPADRVQRVGKEPKELDVEPESYFG